MSSPLPSFLPPSLPTSLLPSLPTYPFPSPPLPLTPLTGLRTVVYLARTLNQDVWFNRMHHLFFASSAARFAQLVVGGSCERWFCFIEVLHVWSTIDVSSLFSVIYTIDLSMCLAWTAGLISLSFAKNISFIYSVVHKLESRQIASVKCDVHRTDIFVIIMPYFIIQKSKWILAAPQRQGIPYGMIHLYRLFTFHYDTSFCRSSTYPVNLHWPNCGCVCWSLCVAHHCSHCCSFLRAKEEGKEWVHGSRMGWWMFFHQGGKFQKTHHSMLNIAYSFLFALSYAPYQNSLWFARSKMYFSLLLLRSRHCFEGRSAWGVLSPPFHLHRIHPLSAAASNSWLVGS